MIVLSSSAAKSLDSSNKVHVYCEAKHKEQANLVVKLDKKYKSEICIFLTQQCFKAEGSIYFDKSSSSATMAYLSESDLYCK
jgi:hypothetical protein